MTDKDDAIPAERFFRHAEEGNGPWEINRPQPVIMTLVEKSLFNGELLDIGCGIADNAIYIAKHANNVHVTGFDMVPKTIQIAREKAENNQLNIRFEVVNILDDLSKSNLFKQHSYDTVLDAAVFHFFSNENRQLYMQNLEYLIKPGGLYIQLCYSEEETFDKGPRRLKKTELTELFSSKNGWTIESIEDSVYEYLPGGPMGESVKAYLSLFRRDNKIL